MNEPEENIKMNQNNGENDRTIRDELGNDVDKSIGVWDKRSVGGRDIILPKY